MSAQKHHHQHSGEYYVQDMRGVPREATAFVESFVTNAMPAQHAEFFRRLEYFPFVTLDAESKPCTTLLCSPIISTLGNNKLRVEAKVSHDSPFVKSILAPVSQQLPKYIAGVGVDFTNRRRNKVAGIASDIDYNIPNGCLSFTMTTNENMGNCPKYITVRSLRPMSRAAKPVVAMTLLNTDARMLLQRSTTAFLGSKHIVGDGTTPHLDSDLGLNHRGGNAGFIRYFEDKRGGHLVLPDYSGNQLFQSLGNVHTDKAVSLLVTDFVSGDMLHVTGTAINLYDDQASAIMPRMGLITIISIERAVLCKQSIQFQLVGEEVTSPYNPPVKLLRTELNSSAATAIIDIAVMATLISIRKDCSTVSTFTFLLSAPMEVPIGGYAIFDFSDIFVKEYEHMNQRNPRSVNDDHTRTWTVSRVSSDHRYISITVKCAGLVSRYLHSLSVGDSTDSVSLSPGKSSLVVPIRGCGGSEFNRMLLLPKLAATSSSSVAAPSLLWFAAGVGITPFLAVFRAFMLHSTASSGTAAAVLNSGSGTRAAELSELYNSITLFYSCRGDEICLIDKQFLQVLPNVTVLVFDSTATEDDVIHGNGRGVDDGAAVIIKRNRRLLKEDVEGRLLQLQQHATNKSNGAGSTAATATNFVAYLCGPREYMCAASGYLTNSGAVESGDIHKESFAF